MTTQDRYGFTMSAILEEQSSFQLVPWLLSTGEDMESLGGEGTVKALSMLAHMVEKGYMPRDCINWSQVDVARQFAAGKCAMMENGPWALPLVEEAGIDYGVVKLPVDERSIVVTGGENFGVIKGKNVDGALALLAYYYEDDVMLRLNEQMVRPGLLSGGWPQSCRSPIRPIRCLPSRWNIALHAAPTRIGQG